MTEIGRSNIRFKLDKPSVDDDEPTRHISTIDPQGPQRKPIGSLADLVRLPDRHQVTSRVSNADCRRDLVVSDAPLLACGRIVFHVVYCTHERYRRQERRELDGAILA